MKFLVIFAAVLLTCNAATVPSMSEEVTPTTEVPIQPPEVVANVVEVSKHQVVPSVVPDAVTPVVPSAMPEVNEKSVTNSDMGVQVTSPVTDKVPVVNVGAVVDVPLNQNLLTPVTVLFQVPMDSVVNVNEPVVVTPTVTEVSDSVETTEFPVDVTEVTTLVAEDEMRTSTDPSHCDRLCTKLELDPICAVNFDCVHEFPNRCVMQTYNCKHPHKAFREVKEDRCKMHWLRRCTEKEMMED